MKSILIIFIFFFTFFLLMGVYFLFKDKKAAEKEILLKRLSPKEEEGEEEERESYFKKQRTKTWADTIFSFIIDIDSLDEFISSANINISIENFLILSSASGILVSISGFFLLKMVFPVFFLFPVGFTLPIFFLIHKKKNRDAALVAQLPEVLDFMVRSLRAGHSVDRAFRGISQNFEDPVGSEISIIYDEISMGLPFIEAMRTFEKKFQKLSDVKLLCSSFIIQRETGGNLTEILDVLSNTIRERFSLKRQVKTLTAEGRMTGMILGLLPVAFGIMMYILNPTYIDFLLNDPNGQKLVFLAIILEIAGFLAMRMLSKIDI